MGDGDGSISGGDNDDGMGMSWYLWKLRGR